MSTAKPRNFQVLVVPILRADTSATTYGKLPAGVFIAGVEVVQTSDASTAAGTIDIGSGSDADAILDAFSMATTKVGHVTAGTKYGVLVGTKLTTDIAVTATYTVGSSTAGGEGYALIYYFVPGPGETGIGD